MPRDLIQNQDPMREQLEAIERSIKLLKGRTTTTFQQVLTSQIADPIEGQIIIDYADNKIKWYTGGAWQQCDCETSGGLILMVNNVEMVFPIADFDANVLETHGAYGQDTYLLAIIDADQQERYVLPQANYQQLNPVWSHDRTKIAYHNFHRVTEQRDLCIVNSDGTGFATLLANAATTRYEEGKAFSPDGSRLALAGTGGGQATYIKVINIDGTNLVSAPTTGLYPYSYDETVHWTADSQWIVSVGFNSVNNHELIVRWNPTTNVIQTIFDFTQYAIDNNFPAYANFSPATMMDVNSNNIAVVAIYNQVIAGTLWGNPFYTQGGPVIMLIECEANATPTFINTENMPDYNWEIYHQIGTVSETTITPTDAFSMPSLDSFSGSGDLDSNWTKFGGVTSDGITYTADTGVWDVSGGAARVLWHLTYPTHNSYAYRNNVGPWADQQAGISVYNSASGGVSYDFQMGLCLRMQTDFSALFIQCKKINTGLNTGKGQVAVYRMNVTATGASTFTLLTNLTALTTWVDGTVIRARLQGQNLKVYRDTTQILNVTYNSTQLPWTSGRVGLTNSAAGNTTSFDISDFYAEEIVTTTVSDSYDYVAYPGPYTIWWNPDGTRFGWTTEVETPPGSPFYREWIGLSMKPDLTEFKVLAHAPNAALGTIAAFTTYTFANTTPPYSFDSYINTFDSSGRMIMTSNSNYGFYPPHYTNDTYEVGDPLRLGYWDSIIGRTIADPTVVRIFDPKAQLPSWDYNSPSAGPEFPVGAVVSDNFNRADAATLGANWTTLNSDSISIVGNKASGAGQNRYESTGDLIYGRGLVTISGLASIRYELAAIRRVGTTYYAIGVYYNHSLGQYGTFYRSESTYYGTAYQPWPLQSLSAGDRLGIQIEDFEVSCYVEISGVWKKLSEVSGFYAITDSVNNTPAEYLNSYPFRIGIHMSGAGGTMENFSAWPYTPEPYVGTRYAITGLPIQTWISDETHDFNY